jgi:hypothetical protein
VDSGTKLNYSVVTSPNKIAIGDSTDKL